MVPLVPLLSYAVRSGGSPNQHPIGLLAYVTPLARSGTYSAYKRQKVHAFMHEYVILCPTAGEMPHPMEWSVAQSAVNAALPRVGM